MPRRVSAAVAYCLAALSVCLAAGSCAPPTVSLHTYLPAALPLPWFTRLRVGEFTVVDAGAPPGGGAATQADAPSATVAVPVTPALAKFVNARLDEHLYMKERINPRLAETQPAGAGGEYFINGTIRAAIRDTRGSRRVQLRAPSTQPAMSKELPTLVRRVRLQVEFAVTWAGKGEAPGGRDLGTVEVVRAYDSALDPAVRGELGLERPDDPNRVPPVEAIVDDLLAQCARAFRCMISPTPIGALVRLRPAWGPEADKAFAAIREHSYGLVVEEFRKALAVDPNSPARIFNFAVAAEAGDEFDLAERHYQRAYGLSGEKDDEAYDGARRCRRVIEARKMPELPAESKGPASHVAN